MGLGVDIVVEAAFGFAPFETITSWTDISAYVKRFKVARGQAPTEAPRIVAGVMDMTLDNDDGRFDPANASGAYSPDVEMSVPVRIRATYNSVTYPVFYGYATGWKVTYPMSGATSIVELRCVDGLALLNSKLLSNDVGATPVYSSGDQSDERCNDVLRLFGWSTALLGTFDEGVATMRTFEQGIDEIQYLEYVQKIVASEPGFGFVDASGVFQFHSRLHYEGGAASLYTFGPADLPYVEASTVYDDTGLFNTATVSGDDFDTQTASVSAAGMASVLSVTGLHSNGHQAMDTADWYVDRFSVLETVFDSFRIKPQGEPATLYPAVLGIELRDPVTVKTAPKTGDALVQQVAITSIRHEVTPDKWLTTFGCGPISDAETIDRWTLGTSLLGVGTVLA